MWFVFYCTFYFIILRTAYCVFYIVCFYCILDLLFIFYMYICRILLIQLLGCHIEMNACLGLSWLGMYRIHFLLNPAGTVWRRISAGVSGPNGNRNRNQILWWLLHCFAYWWCASLVYKLQCANVSNLICAVAVHCNAWCMFVWVSK